MSTATVKLTGEVGPPPEAVVFCSETQSSTIDASLSVGLRCSR
jgi:hypothetical protein